MLSFLLLIPLLYPILSVLAIYEIGLSDIHWLKVLKMDITKETPMRTIIFSDQRGAIIDYLYKNGITAYRDMSSIDKAKYIHFNQTFENSHIFDDQALLLPCGPHQSLENIDQVIRVLKEFKG